MSDFIGRSGKTTGFYLVIIVKLLALSISFFRFAIKCSKRLVLFANIQP